MLIFLFFLFVISSGKRVRPGRMIKRWARLRGRADEPFLPHDQGMDMEDEALPEDADEDVELENGEFVYYYLVPPKRQHDPNPHERLTTQLTLESYHRLSHGTCVIAPRGEEAFCKVKFMPFSSMSPEELRGWEKLVCFFLDYTNYVEPVKNNGPLMGGEMWAGGWRKSSKRGESFGRYCSVQRLVAMMEQCLYNPQDEAAAFREANDWIALHLQEMAPGIFDKYREVLIGNSLPSMGSMEYHTPYEALDFASFFTFTMYNFFNKDHQDTDANNWTLVCWIPIFNPQTSSETDPILADEGLDMRGGQFTFRDFQVYLDLNEVVGVTFCVFKSNDHTHQTLKGVSHSDKYTRIGFSCQMSEKMSNAVVAYIQAKAANKAKKIAGQQVQIAQAKARLARKR